jgi:tetratricopeptide (TPR) repeat protein
VHNVSDFLSEPESVKVEPLKSTADQLNTLGSDLIGQKEKTSDVKSDAQGKMTHIKATSTKLTFSLLVPESVNDELVKSKADQLKELGNKHIGQKEYEQGLECYTKAIELYNKEPIYYSNRGHCHCVNDCNRAIELNANFFRPYYRRMQAYEQLQKYEEAIMDGVKVLELSDI